MKLVIDEKLKHRLVGISVILSLGAIFLPAMMKKSGQRLENNFSVQVKLPPKPIAPNVVMTDEDQMFKTIKVAKIDPAPATREVAAATDLSKEDFVATTPVIEEAAVTVAKTGSAARVADKPLELTVNDAAQSAVKKEVQVAVRKQAPSVKVAAKAVNIAKTRIAAKPVVRAQAVKRDMYAVQLASFSKLTNAQALVTKLQRKGYKANYVRTPGRNGIIYKVFVGHSPSKDSVVKLKMQLASAMQLNGFVVNTGVS